MSRKLAEPKGKRVNKLEYTPAVPSFLQNYGKPKMDDSPPRQTAHPGREPLPQRPRDGKWAGGSDDEGEVGRKGGEGGGDEIEDEWDLKFGGGRGDDGPQVVVLKEGKHITKEELEAERRKAAGLPPLPSKASEPSSPPREKMVAKKEATTTAVIPEPSKLSAHGPLAKRKAELAEIEAEKKAAQAKRKKKSKASKGMLSFGDDE